jgi:hypothetical protein
MKNVVHSNKVRFPFGSSDLVCSGPPRGYVGLGTKLSQGAPTSLGTQDKTFPGGPYESMMS